MRLFSIRMRCFTFLSHSNETIRRFHTLSGSLSFHAEEAVQEHTVVLDYLRDGRFDLAEQALRSHLEQVQQRMFAK